jgi:long-chain-fatty-acid--[acyl-carrier-protein] ligase
MPTFIEKLMNKINRWVFYIFHLLGFKLRYKIELKGFDILYKPKPTDQKGGWLILSAHPSHIDGNMLVCECVKKRFYVNVWTSDVVKHFSYFHWCMQHSDLFNFIWIPSAEDKKSSPEVAQEIQALIDQTVKGLKEGQNYIIFPAAHPKYFPKNQMRGKSAVGHILKVYPEANIVFVRIKGLWGSRFSRAFKPEEDRYRHPSSLGEHLSIIFKKFIRSIFLNGIFFMPKRRVEFEFIPAPEDFPRYGSRIEINRYIEHMMNYGWGIEGEPVYRVSEYFWKDEFLDHEYEEKRYSFDIDLVPEDIREDIVKWMYEKSSLGPHQMDFDMSLGRDLGLDSLDLQDLLILLENKYGVTNVVPNDLATVGHVIALAGKIPIQETLVKKKFYKVITQHAALPKFWDQIKKFFKGKKHAL